MHPVTRTVLRYARDILILLIVLVVLARTNKMPVVIPDQVTDFLIDATNEVLSGRAFSSATGFLTDVADLVLAGGLEREHRRVAAAYRDRTLRYFERLGRNLSLVADASVIRQGLPDFGNELGAAAARASLEDVLAGTDDVDLLSLVDARGLVAARAARDGAKPIDESAAFREHGAKARDAREPVFTVLPDGRLLAVVACRSLMREQVGALVMVLNGKGLAGLLADLAEPGERLLFIADEDARLVVSSAAAPGDFKQFLDKFKAGRFAFRYLAAQRYVALDGRTCRVIVEPLGAGAGGLPLAVGYLGPEGSLVDILVLLARLCLLVAGAILLYLLGRRVWAHAVLLARERSLSYRLLLLAMDKSAASTQRLAGAARGAVDAARGATRLAIDGAELASRPRLAGPGRRRGSSTEAATVPSAPTAFIVGAAASAAPLVINPDEFHWSEEHGPEPPADAAVPLSGNDAELVRAPFDLAALERVLPLDAVYDGNGAEASLPPA